jgi:alpha-mannosidase
VHGDRRPFDELLIAGPVDRIGHAEARRLEYRPARMRDRLGPLWATYWLRATATVPEAWAGSRVDLIWETGTESTLWLDGRPAQGLVTGQYHRPVAALVESAQGRGRGVGVLELGCKP